MTLTKQDLMGFPEATSMVERNRELRQRGRARLGLTEHDLANLLGVSDEMVHALESGSLDIGVSPYDFSRHAMPLETMNTSTARTVVLYRRFLSACEQLPQGKETPTDVPGAELVQGAANLAQAAWLASGIQGHAGAFNGSTMPSPTERLQALSTFGLNTSTVAQVCKSSAADIESWLLADRSALPWNRDKGFTTLTHVLHWLASGPTASGASPRPISGAATF